MVADEFAAYNLKFAPYTCEQDRGKPTQQPWFVMIGTKTPSGAPTASRMFRMPSDEHDWGPECTLPPTFAVKAEIEVPDVLLF
jgi:hypothetical protein